jgi:hypothetical protein
MRSRLYRRETYCLWPQQLWDIKERERFMMNFFIAGGPGRRRFHFADKTSKLFARRQIVVLAGRIYLSGRAQLRNAPLRPVVNFTLKCVQNCCFSQQSNLRAPTELLFTNAQTPRSPDRRQEVKVKYATSC